MLKFNANFIYLFKISLHFTRNYFTNLWSYFMNLFRKYRLQEFPKFVLQGYNHDDMPSDVASGLDLVLYFERKNY